MTLKQHKELNKLLRRRAELVKRHAKITAELAALDGVDYISTYN